MHRTLLASALLILGYLGVVRADEAQVPLKLDENKNCRLEDSLGSGFTGNTLAALGQGEQTLAGVRFKVGPGLQHLGSKGFPKYPAKIEGIAVGRKFKTLAMLHATCGGGPNEEGTEGYVADGTLVGHYLVHYVDGATKAIPIAYGNDIRDWWSRADEKPPSNAAVAWVGHNPAVTQYNLRLRLYISKWTNPSPTVEVKSIDFASRFNETEAAPFCVAITTIE